MMTLLRREPLEVPAVSRLFGELLNDPFFANAKLSQLDETTLPLDISEDEKAVIVRASVPGFAKNEIEVEVNNGFLSIKAERTEEKEDKNETYFRRERRFGALSRHVALPSTVEESGTQAELKDGVLTLRIPKSAKALPRKVQIK